MSKTKTAYVCTECGTVYPKWMGKCTACESWNTIEEEVISVSKSSDTRKRTKEPVKPILLEEVDLGEERRISTGIGELDRVLGGGLVGGAVVLVGGQPGIGKSTLMLQMSLLFPEEVIYVSGEESVRQIKIRAERLSANSHQCWLLSETRVENILNLLEKQKPGLVVIDSVQTLRSDVLESTAGTISQIRLCTQKMIEWAKEENVPVILIGHITKDGQIAGPKLLEHMVDVVLQFEGDNQHAYRILRTMKNRYGSTDEIGLFEMMQAGLREVENPSEMLLSQSDQAFSGSSVAATMEGLRPILVEVQALVSPAVYGNPQRSATGFDLRRLSMLLAVLEKRLGFKFGQQDVFLNMAGGLNVKDPATDLAVVASLLSSYNNAAFPSNYCFAAEVGLSGEIRPVHRAEQRIKEADRLGFTRVFVSERNLKGLDKKSLNVQCIPLKRVEDILPFIKA